MVRYSLPSALVVLACSRDVTAFMPLHQRSARLDNARWRLEQADTPMPSESYQMNTNSALSPIYTGAIAQGDEKVDSNSLMDAVDMTGFKSSFQGLTGPSKAGLGLTFLLAGGMAYACPDVPPLTLDIDAFSTLVASSDFDFLKSQVPSTDWIGQLGTDILPMWSQNMEILLAKASSQQASVQQILDQARSQSDVIQADIAAQTAQLQVSLSRLADSTAAQAWDWQTSMATQFEVFQSEASPMIQRVEEAAAVQGAAIEMTSVNLAAQASSTASRFQEAALIQTSYMKDSFDTTTSEMQHKLAPQMKLELDSLATLLRSSMSEQSIKVQEYTVATMSQIQDITETKTGMLESEVIPQANDAVASVSSSLQTTVTQQWSNLQSAVSIVANQLQTSFAAKSDEIMNQVLPKMSDNMATFGRDTKSTLELQIPKSQELLSTSSKTLSDLSERTLSLVSSSASSLVSKAHNAATTMISQVTTDVRPEMGATASSFASKVQEAIALQSTALPDILATKFADAAQVNSDAIREVSSNVQAFAAANVPSVTIPDVSVIEVPTSSITTSTTLTSPVKGVVEALAIYPSEGVSSQYDRLQNMLLQ